MIEFKVIRIFESQEEDTSFPDGSREDCSKIADMLNSIIKGASNISYRVVEKRGIEVRPE